jgi:hypothetical protein
MTVPFKCDACGRWIPNQPPRDLFGLRRIMVSGICESCLDDGWDYDEELNLKLCTDLLEEKTN